MTRRRPISKHLRFNVLKRDGFRCVYCGASALITVLHVDHVIAVAAGGKSTAENLVTACEDCNLGKSDVSLETKSLRDLTVEEIDAADERLTKHLRSFTAHPEFLRGNVMAQCFYWSYRFGYWPPRDVVERLDHLKVLRIHDVFRAIDELATAVEGETPEETSRLAGPLFIDWVKRCEP